MYFVLTITPEVNPPWYIEEGGLRYNSVLSSHESYKVAAEAVRKLRDEGKPATLFLMKLKKVSRWM